METINDISSYLYDKIRETVAAQPRKSINLVKIGNRDRFSLTIGGMCCGGGWMESVHECTRLFIKQGWLLVHTPNEDPDLRESDVDAFEDEDLLALCRFLNDHGIDTGVDCDAISAQLKAQENEG